MKYLVSKCLNYLAEHQQEFSDVRLLNVVLKVNCNSIYQKPVYSFAQ